MGGGSGGARRDLALFPALYNVVGLLLIGALYALSPSHSVDSVTLNTVLYLGVFATHWTLAAVVWRRLGSGGLRALIEPGRRLRWLPSALVFVALKALFTSYIALGLADGRIPRWGSMGLPRVFFFLVVCPLTAGFVEELIWRGTYWRDSSRLGVGGGGR